MDRLRAADLRPFHQNAHFLSMKNKRLIQKVFIKKALLTPMHTSEILLKTEAVKREVDNFFYSPTAPMIALCSAPTCSARSSSRRKLPPQNASISLRS